MCVPATGRQGSSMSIHSWEAVKLYICSFLGISLYLSLLYGLPLLLIVPILSREDVDDDEFPRIPSCPPPTTIFCLHDLVHLQLCRISIAGATAQELECIPTSCSSAAAPLDLVVVAAIRCIKIPHPIPSAGIVSNWAAIHRPGGIELR